MNIVVKNDKFFSILDEFNIENDIEFIYFKFDLEEVHIRVITYNFVCLILYKLNISIFEKYEIKKEEICLINYNLLLKLIKFNQESITEIRIEENLVIFLISNCLELKHKNLLEESIMNLDIPNKKLNLQKVNVEILKKLYTIQEIKNCNVLTIKNNKNSTKLFFIFENKDIFLLKLDITLVSKIKNSLDIKLNNNILNQILNKIKDDLIFINTDKTSDYPFVFVKKTFYGEIHFLISDII